MAEYLGKWPSKRGPISHAVPLAVERRYNFHEFGWHLGNVGLKFFAIFRTVGCDLSRHIGAPGRSAETGGSVMYARMSRFKIKRERIDDVKEFRNSRLPKLRQLDGLKYLLGLAADDGECLVVAIYESEEHAESPQVLAVAGDFWFRMGGIMEDEGMTIRKYNVMHFDDFTAGTA